MREYLDPGWIDYLFGVLFMGTWQAVLWCAASISLCRLVRLAAVRAAIWTICIVGMFAVPFISPLFPRCFVGYGSLHEPLHFPTHIVHSPSRVHVWSHVFEAEWWCGVRQILVIIWLTGMAVALLRVIWGWVGIVRLMRFA